jgi:hypothetical protein
METTEWLCDCGIWLSILDSPETLSYHRSPEHEAEIVAWHDAQWLEMEWYSSHEL